jgi:hypothetical protein
MEDKKLLEDLKLLVENNNAFSDETKERLLLYKNEGGTEKSAMSVCEDLRKLYPEGAFDNSIDDILDIIVGFCSADMRVNWD